MTAPPAPPNQPPTRVRATVRASRRRWVQYGLLFLTATLIVNALIGDRGLTALIKAKREYASKQHELNTLRAKNAKLQDEVSRLTSDPRTIEEAARRVLGVAGKDERIFLLRDAKPAPR